MPEARDSVRISPTAHYTSMVWARGGLSHAAFTTPEGRLLYGAARPAMALSRRFGGPTLEGLLLARHEIIDRTLREAISSGRVSQVIEIAAGLSPRGWSFSREFGKRLRYIEADLPDMAARKRAAIAFAGGGGPGHDVVDIDAFAETGEASLAGIAATLDPQRPVAIVTEGLLNYFPLDAVQSLWARIAATLANFPGGLYLSDLHLAGENRGTALKTFVRLLSAFVRGRVHLHFANCEDARAALLKAGFDTAELRSPADFADRIEACSDPAARLVRIVVATTSAHRDPVEAS